MAKKTIRDIPLQGKRVVLRSEFNVPIKDGGIGDDIRIRAELPTLRYILDQGAAVLILTHLGRPKGKPAPEMSVKPVADRLATLLGQPVGFIPYGAEEDIQAAAAAIPFGQAALLENTRFWAEEEKNDGEFSRFLSTLGDTYVNDAFGAAHRAHCSTEGIGHFLPAVAGFLMEKEIAALGETVERPQRPFVVVMGGAKVSDKIALIENLADKADEMLFGGAMANTLLAADGYAMGDSKIETDKLELVREMMARVRQKKCRLVYPKDFVAADEFSPDANIRVVAADQVPAGWMALDIGPVTVSDWAEIFAGAGTIIWNGPLGVYEMAPFAGGSNGVARAMAASPGITVVGGGDAVAAARQAGCGEQMSHLSTGGGASLELLEGKKLPGIEILRDK
ncbi:MAG: phosphoglycerate kinase [Peptococcaceae bacterium]|jgi:phosphoglycerate kinase|nr:phosphoglycerate kinase [Peptococcaceae bacterium]